LQKDHLLKWHLIAQSENFQQRISWLSHR